MPFEPPQAPAAPVRRSAPAPAAQRPSYGPPSAETRRIQQALGIPADGIMGPQTRAAIENFQRTHGLAVDGIVGAHTSAALFGGSGGGGGSSRGGGGGAGGGGSAAGGGTDWSQTAEGRAANFGWSQAVINSNPELKTLFGQASAQNWTPDHFIAKVRDTQWFKTHSDTARQSLILQQADPATYNERLNQSIAQATAMVGQVGANVTAAQLKQIGHDAMMFGWTQDELKQHMAAFVTAGTGGQYVGSAGTYQLQYQQMVNDYGASVPSQTMATWIKNSELGTLTPDGVKNYLIQQSASKYPALADRLHSGETIRQIADPYMQSYAKTLELNPNTISLTDPKIQQALQSTDANGKPATQSVWQFEQGLRNDPRYARTQQAQDTAMQMGHQVLQDWGLING